MHSSNTQWQSVKPWLNRFASRRKSTQVFDLHWNLHWLWFSVISNCMYLSTLIVHIFTICRSSRGFEEEFGSGTQWNGARRCDGLKKVCSHVNLTGYSIHDIENTSHSESLERVAATWKPRVGYIQYSSGSCILVNMPILFFYITPNKFGTPN